MSDLIRREEAIEAMEKSEWGYLWECEQVINVARTLPSAEPERKKGEWLVQPSTGDDRPMKSLTTVIEVLESCQNDAIECFECPMRHETECEVKSVALAYLKEYQSAKDDLDEKRLKYMNAIAEFEDNPVLTWEQLKTMKGKPVWVEYESCNRKEWTIVDCFYTDAFQKVKMNVALPHDYWNLEKEMIGVIWQAYRKERSSAG